jgi:hypothetical protein
MSGGVGVVGAGLGVLDGLEGPGGGESGGP